ncbi:MAG: hypothetical protein CR955_00680 [Thiotrichales bacterium]|nr:MAG: hypothetical protein CR955_00680 [Thiotrichales bacterium]
MLLVLLLISAPQAFSANGESKDSDGDGLSDQVEAMLGLEAYLSDTDGDGIKDGVEVGKNIKKPLDSDNDKRIDALDYDDDNDGLPTFLESKNDTDKDGLKDYLDTDSDNDGLSDGAEAGFLNQDNNNDGIDDAFDASGSGKADENGDGINDNFKLPDHNNDGIADYLDATFKKTETLASSAVETKTQANHTDQTKKIDNTENASQSNDVVLAKKNIAKNPEQKDSLKKSPSPMLSETKPLSRIESSIKKKAETAAPSTLTEKVKKTKKEKQAKPQKSNVNRYTDTDNDGLLDSQERILGTDIMKRDSDGDKVSDAIEVGMDIKSPQDSDRDGIIDALDNDDDNDGVLTQFEDINKDGTAINDDTDQDGVPNYLDANDDGDSRLTKVEGGTKDSDGDGILDYLDKNDGVKNKAPKIATKEKLPDEPEVVVLFDGNMESLPLAPAPEENNDSAKQAIESAVLNGSLDKPANRVITDNSTDNVTSDTATSETNEQTKNAALDSKKQALKPKKVVLDKETPPAKKEKGGIMQWLTSLLPD